ncbi:GLE1-like protein [Phlyctema vagabunda]|uniref:mRNA export factor GLE1 n=1 Tax=Phlyctema vagabunda TaxID=108571 RepID=A0ABR4PXG8_9HELO
MGDPTITEDDLSSRMKENHIGAPKSKSKARQRTAEDVHTEALDAAQAEHKRVRDCALRVFELHRVHVEREKVQRAIALEEERIRLETAKAKEEIRLRELKATHIRAPPPPPEPVPAPRAPSPPPVKETAQPEPPKQVAAPAAEVKAQPSQPQPQPTSGLFGQTQQQKPASTVSAIPPAQAIVPQPAAAPVAKVIAPIVQSAPPKPVPVVAQAPQPQSYVFPTVDRYMAIHKTLKKLRKHLADEGKTNIQLKKKVGEMRREIRKSVGQLIEGKGANKQPIAKIQATLTEALTLQSPPIDPSIVMLSKPDPKEGAVNNGETLPILFIYLLNIFAKAIVAQFIDEAGVSPKAADPIGVVAVSIFSKPDLLWRGESLIDILMAKMRISCPVLFGVRGNEGTEEGRARLGWKKDGDHWVIEQEHNTRMAGLGAGYAAISLRDYSRTRLKNPYPPRYYWQTMASIVSTPANQTSSTQYMVLKALIDGYEQRFMMFYGHAARAALQVALVDFPSRAKESNVALSSLKVLADKLARDMGLRLQHNNV